MVSLKDTVMRDEIFKESSLARRQARSLLLDYGFYYRFILLGLIYVIPMTVILGWALLMAALDKWT